MKLRLSNPRRVVVLVLSLAVVGGMLLPSTAAAQAKFEIKNVAEKKLKHLPAGPLYWRVENLPTLAQAQAAAGETSLAAEVSGKVWLFTLGPAGGASTGGTKMVEVGPLPTIAASEYLLRVNEASGPPGSVTPVHSHPGSEAAYVLAGEQSFRTPHGVTRVAAGRAEAGHGPGMPMQVSSSGAEGLRALVMFVVDAGKPFSKPETMP